MEKVSINDVREILLGMDGENFSLKTMTDDEFVQLSLEEDLEIDSLEFVLLQMEIEKRCRVSLMNVPQWKLEKVNTIGEFIDICKTL